MVPDSLAYAFRANSSAARLGRVDQITAGADHDVIPAEHRGDLVRRRGAAVRVVPRQGPAPMEYVIGRRAAMGAAQDGDG